MRIDLPQNVNFIIDRLYEHGFEAYAVGGCVRDSLLGRTPQDWDITTSAKPAQVKAIFDHTIDTGIQHGTVTVMLEHVGYEVTTYRIDGEYEDARHPKEVTFTSYLKLDLERRDFTINAMAYNNRTVPIITATAYSRFTLPAIKDRKTAARPSTATFTIFFTSLTEKTCPQRL